MDKTISAGFPFEMRKTRVHAKFADQREITVCAKHYVTEECQDEVGEAVADFVKQVGR